jgi:hypothetical protein
MKTALRIVGVLIALTGLVFALQGIGLLQGSTMTNQPEWLLIGLLMIIIGIGLIVVNRRQTAVGNRGS